MNINTRAEKCSGQTYYSRYGSYTTVCIKYWKWKSVRIKMQGLFQLSSLLGLGMRLMQHLVLIQKEVFAYLSQLLFIPDLVIGSSTLPLLNAWGTPLLNLTNSLTLQGRIGRGGGGEGEKGKEDMRRRERRAAWYT